MKDEIPAVSAGGEVLQLVCFKLAGEEYAVNITSVQEVIRVPAITPVPQMPDFVLGVSNIRGTIVPVCDLRKLFRLPQKPGNGLAKILILEAGRARFSIIVDEVLDNIKLEKTLIDPAPDVKLKMEKACISGLGEVADRMIIILDVSKVSEVINSEIDKTRV